MNRLAIAVLPEAEAELSEAFLWYFSRSPVAANAFRNEAIEAIDRLQTGALAWPEDDDGIRHTLLKHFPYTIYFEIRDTTVTVLALAHQRRKPGYWRAHK